MCHFLSTQRCLQTVILAGTSRKEAVRINSITHAAGVPLIFAETRGVFARVFSDFGDSFSVVDTDGECWLLCLGCSPLHARQTVCIPVSGRMACC